MADQPTIPGPIGYAVIEEREGEYGNIDPRRVFRIDDTADDDGERPTADETETARAAAQTLAMSLAAMLNERDAEDVASWRVIALTLIR